MATILQNNANIFSMHVYFLFIQKRRLFSEFDSYEKSFKSLIYIDIKVSVKKKHFQNLKNHITQEEIHVPQKLDKIKRLLFQKSELEYNLLISLFKSI